MQEGEYGGEIRRREKGGRELLEKWWGTSTSLCLAKAGLADKVSFDTMLDAAGSEGGQ